MTNVYEAVDGVFEQIATMEGHESEVKCVTWQRGGSLVATCARDKVIWIWESIEPSAQGMGSDITDFECVTVLQGHTQDVKCVRWHPSEPLLVSASYDETLKVWEEGTDDWNCTSTLKDHNATVWSCVFDGSGERFASCSDDGVLMIWKRFSKSDNKWQRVCTLQGYAKRALYSVDWCQISDLIACAGADNNILVFKQSPMDVAEGPLENYDLEFKAEQAHGSDVNCVSWNPVQPGMLASAGDDGIVKLWQWID